MARFCEYCGSPLEEDARFCMECGHPVDVMTQPTQQPSQQPASQSTPQQQPGPQLQPMKPMKKGLFVKVFLIASLVAVLGYGAEEYYQYRHEKKVYKELTKDLDKLNEQLKNKDSESQDTPKASKSTGKEEKETIRLKYYRIDFWKKEDAGLVDGDAVRLAINNAFENSDIVALQRNNNFSFNSTGNYSYYGSNPEDYFTVADATLTVNGHVGESTTNGTFTMEATVVCRKKDAEVGYEGSDTVTYEISGDFFPSKTWINNYEFSGKGSVENKGEIRRSEKLVKLGVDPVTELNVRLEDGGDLSFYFKIERN